MSLVLFRLFDNLESSVVVLQTGSLAPISTTADLLAANKQEKTTPPVPKKPVRNLSKIGFENR